MNALTLLKESMEREITHETSVLERFLREKPDQTYNIDRIRRQLSIKKDQSPSGRCLGAHACLGIWRIIT